VSRCNARQIKSAIEMSDRVSVLFAIPALDKGGPDRVFFELLRSVDRRCFSVSVVVSGDSGHYLSRLPDDVSVYCLPRERGFLSRYPVWRLARLVRRLRPDVVITTLRMTLTAGMAEFAFPRKTALISRQAIRLSQNAQELRRRSPIKHRLSQYLQLAALARARRLICQSQDMARPHRAKRSQASLRSFALVVSHATKDSTSFSMPWRCCASSTETRC
jgi:hypothetical protein